MTPPPRLLHGPYHAPPLKRGDRATCLFRDGEVVVTGWSDGRIPWPRCRRAGERGGYGLLVDAELARAVRRESSQAVQYWFGVTVGVVWRWRKALGVERFNEGSALLHGEVTARAGAANRGRKLRPEEIERRRQTALELGLRPEPPHVGGRPWTRAELRLLGKAPDDELARRIGRTANAVRVKRTKLNIPTARDRRRKAGP